MSSPEIESDRGQIPHDVQVALCMGARGRMDAITQAWLKNPAVIGYVASHNISDRNTQSEIGE